MSKRTHAILLAGGKSRRMKQRKELLLLNGKPILLTLAEQLLQICGTVTVVSDRTYSFLPPEVTVVQDEFPGQGPIAGIHAGMLRHHADWHFVVACDYPLLKAETLQLLLSGAEQGWDGLVPVVHERKHYLCAIYHQRTFPCWEKALTQQRLKVSDTVDKLRIKYVPFVQHTEAFINMNTPEEYEAVLRSCMKDPS